jgi:hypothetical protein
MRQEEGEMEAFSKVQTGVNCHIVCQFDHNLIPG